MDFSQIESNVKKIEAERLKKEKRNIERLYIAVGKAAVDEAKENGNFSQHLQKILDQRISAKADRDRLGIDKKDNETEA